MTNMSLNKAKTAVFQAIDRWNQQAEKPIIDI